MKSRELATAISFAANAHLKQTTRDGLPYILHPLHVMSTVDSPLQKAIAVLHDVIEDTGFKADHLLAAGIPQKVVDGVEILTKERGQDYFDYIRSIIEDENLDAMLVKMADLTHNMDLTRLPVVEAKDELRTLKYKTAFRLISEGMDKIIDGAT